MQYVVLLRGINVGGKNRVPMAQLKTALEGAGYANVRTYINSGNIIVSSNCSSEEKLQQSIEVLIKSKFGFAVKTLVKSRENFVKIAKAIPENFTNDAGMKCDILFLWEKYAAIDAMLSLPIKKGIDAAIATDGAIIWSVARKNVTRSGLSKLIGTDLYAHTTIRNCNTVRKLYILLDA